MIIIVGDLRCKMNKKGPGILFIEMIAGRISITVKLVLTEMTWIFGLIDKYVPSSYAIFTHERLAISREVLARLVNFHSCFITIKLIVITY
jgi:hypothetical protein